MLGNQPVAKGPNHKDQAPDDTKQRYNKEGTACNDAAIWSVFDGIEIAMLWHGLVAEPKDEHDVALLGCGVKDPPAGIEPYIYRMPNTLWMCCHGAVISQSGMFFR